MTDNQKLGLRQRCKRRLRAAAHSFCCFSATADTPCPAALPETRRRRTPFCREDKWLSLPLVAFLRDRAKRGDGNAIGLRSLRTHFRDRKQQSLHGVLRPGGLS